MKSIWAIIAFAAILLLGPISVGPVAFADGEDIGFSVGTQSVMMMTMMTMMMTMMTMMMTMMMDQYVFHHASLPDRT